MDRRDCAILVNSCQKYFYLLEPFFGMLRRYAPDLKWPVYFATEKWNDYNVHRTCTKYNVEILKLDEKDADFLESRVAGVKMLPPEIRYVLPLQEDFLLERPGPNGQALKEALGMFDAALEILSMRLMPCPGPKYKTPFFGKWHRLMLGELSEMIFSYQATIWRREVYVNYLSNIIQHGHELNPGLTGQAWNRYAIRINPAETYIGQTMLVNLYPEGVHLCWNREGEFANAVYMCPWPYRPTAIVQGVLQPWAEELVQREGFKSMPSLR
jgi:hypothetical protein